MEAYMATAFCPSEEDSVENIIKEQAKQSILSIKVRDTVIRDAKHALEEYGVFDTYKKALAYIQKKAEVSEYPLYITKDEDDRYLVKEYTLKGLDGIPIHNRDILFFPDDSFLKILFRYPENEEKESLNSLFFTVQKVDGSEEYFPETFAENKTYKIGTRYFPETFEEIKTYEIGTRTVKCRLRAWSVEEKIDYINTQIDKTITNSKTECGIDCIKLLASIATFFVSDAILRFLLSFQDLKGCWWGILIIILAISCAVGVTFGIGYPIYALWSGRIFEDLCKKRRFKKLALETRKKMKTIRADGFLDKEEFYRLYLPWKDKDSTEIEEIVL